MASGKGNTGAGEPNGGRPPAGAGGAGGSALRAADARTGDGRAGGVNGHHGEAAGGAGAHADADAGMGAGVGVGAGLGVGVEAGAFGGTPTAADPLAGASPMAAPGRPDVRPGATRFNRDLSWLEFNARVLHQAFDERVPLLERVRFLAIFTTNLDEFVMKRVGYLKRAVEARLEPGAAALHPAHGPHALSHTPGGGEAPSRAVDEPLSAAELLAVVRATFEHLEQQQAYCFERLVRPALAREGIELLDYAQLGAAERTRLERWFKANVFPVLTPLAVDKGHRFPFISNLSNNLGVLLAEPGSDEQLFARVKIPPQLPQWVRVPAEDDQATGASGGASLAGAGAGAGAGVGTGGVGRGRFVQLFDLIRHNLDELFSGMRIIEVIPFRVTRAADGSAASDGAGGGAGGDVDNLLDLVEQQLKRRRFASVVRLEVARGVSARSRRALVEMLKIRPEDVDDSHGLLEFRSLTEIADLPRPDLKHAPWQPVIPARLAEADRSIFSVIRAGDVLVHHPYESFAASAERFIAEAAGDPHVLAIKQTIYRTSRESPFVQHLIRAAESGKQVACLVEVRARFDEGRNVRLAQMLEKAGVHVAYGVVGLKTHCKAALVVRREGEALRCYAHLGTGNYNPATAQLYTDLGLFTCDPALTEDVVGLFNLLTGRSLKRDYRKLLVAPATMKSRFIELIRREAEHARRAARGEGPGAGGAAGGGGGGGGGGPVGGRIVAKMNAMEDAAIMHELYRAARAGVRVHLFVRGFCCLRPGVEGLSENIRVTSVVGRFLEHSRIFHFGNGRADPAEGEWFFGSADWMYRNLEQRVEAVVPVEGRALRRRLARIMDVMAGDARCAWDLRPDGRYALRMPEPDAPAEGPQRLGTFETLMRDALTQG